MFTLSDKMLYIQSNCINDLIWMEPATIPFQRITTWIEKSLVV